MLILHKMEDGDNRRDLDAAPAPVRGGLEQRAYEAIEKDIKEVQSNSPLFLQLQALLSLQLTVILNYFPFIHL